MKKIIFLPFVLVILISMSAVKKTKIVFFGDSITQAGVSQGGYIDRIQNYLSQQSLQEKYELAGAGIGGNKVYDLYLRMEDDVLAKDPQVVVIYVGINDVWHKTSSGTGTDLDKYEKFYVAIIKKLQAKNIKVAVCTPSVIGEKKNNANPQDADLEKYSAVIRKLATTYNCILIDLRAAFTQYEKENNAEDKESGILTTDRVHLNEKGNQLVADEMIKALTIR
ncbi:SGNH/GDSL hydrolase family protein [Terrimonas alba]|uniref:SGNH/GDSL hydrolase family protein n=1 Tax=Terrimonas alba TaxID=3349636 RepID=UPI0035F4CA76